MFLARKPDGEGVQVYALLPEARARPRRWRFGRCDAFAPAGTCGLAAIARDRDEAVAQVMSPAAERVA
jgi:hypothetical protein